MIDPIQYLQKLNDSGVNFFAGVPDSLLKPFCACVTDTMPESAHVIAVNEGAAVAQGIGYHLGTGKLPLIYLQNSGLGNIINPLLSLASNEVYGTPMIVMIGWRGEPGVKDEPQHVHQGRVMEETLQAMNIPYIILGQSDAEAYSGTQEAIALAEKTDSPVVMLVRKGTFGEYKFKKPISQLKMSREEAIALACETLPAEAMVICTTGMPSRELFEHRAAKKEGHHRDFLTVGGMGHASQIALSLASFRDDLSVFCFDGDGAALMHMGSLGSIGQSSRQNLTHIIFNNGVHDSVGGQPTIGFGLSFAEIALACGYSSACKVDSRASLISAIENANTHDGPHMIDVWVRPGNRADLGRPTSTPAENKIDLMNHLKDEE